jgi:hypothetical protein
MAVPINARYEARKAELQTQCAEPIARLANTSAHLNTLRNTASAILSAGDADEIGTLLQRLASHIDGERERLQAARDAIGAIHPVKVK